MHGRAAPADGFVPECGGGGRGYLYTRLRVLFLVRGVDRAEEPDEWRTMIQNGGLFLTQTGRRV